MVPRLTGILEWDGVGFDCVDADNTFGSNLLPLLTSEDPSHCTEERGLCGPYSGSLSCLGNGSVISDLSFIARYSMNGGFIECAFRYDVIETILLQVGGNAIHGCLLFCMHELVTCGQLHGTNFKVII